MHTEELAGQVRALRARGCSPKQIARSLGLPPAAVAPLVRTIAAQDQAAAPEREVVECWVSPGWSGGLTVEGHPEWPDVDADDMGSGLVTVLIAREEGRSRVSLCVYLVDTYCLGVKDALGPRVVDRHRVFEVTRNSFAAYDAPPLPAPLELAQHLVFGAVEYARGLGFAPAPDFEAAAGHLGAWTGPSAIGFGRRGKPYFVDGPYDDVEAILNTLQRSVGYGNYDFLVNLGPGIRASVGAGAR